MDRFCAHCKAAEGMEHKPSCKKNTSEGFKKFDQGKPEFHHVAEFANELGMVNRALDYGAAKYGRDNWKLGSAEKDVSRNKSAAIRHVFSSLRGEFSDPESGIEHLAHAIAGLLFVMWHERVNTGKGVGSKACPPEGGL